MLHIILSQLRLQWLDVQLGILKEKGEDGEKSVGKFDVPRRLCHGAPNDERCRANGGGKTPLEYSSSKSCAGGSRQSRLGLARKGA